MKEEVWNELYLYLIRMEIGVFKNFKECARWPCNGNHYVGLAPAVSPTNTNFQFTFLLTRLQEALYEDLAV